MSQADNPPETKFVDCIDTDFDSTIPYDLRFFQMLDRFIQREPWLERDKAMIGALKTIGIEKGKPFAPDAKTKEILEDAIAEAHAYLDSRLGAIFDPPFNEGKHWALPADPAFAEAVMTNYGDPNAYPVEGRGLAYSYAYFSAKHLGTGQYYLMTIVDKDGEPFDGARHLSPECAREPAGETLLVGNCLRPGNTRADPRCEVAQSRFKHTRTPKER